MLTANRKSRRSLLSANQIRARKSYPKHGGHAPRWCMWSSLHEIDCTLICLEKKYRSSRLWSMIFSVVPIKHRTFVQYLYNVGPTSKTWGRYCRNVIQMFFCTKCFVFAGYRSYTLNNIGSLKRTLQYYYHATPGEPCKGSPGVAW